MTTAPHRQCALTAASDATNTRCLLYFWCCQCWPPYRLFSGCLLWRLCIRRLTATMRWTTTLTTAAHSTASLTAASGAPNAACLLSWAPCQLFSGCLLWRLSSRRLSASTRLTLTTAPHSTAPHTGCLLQWPFRQLPIKSIQLIFCMVPDLPEESATWAITLTTAPHSTAPLCAASDATNIGRHVELARSTSIEGSVLL